MNEHNLEKLWNQILFNRVNCIVKEAMIAENVEAWLITSSEYNEDPLFRSLSGYFDYHSRGVSAYMMILKDNRFYAYSINKIDSSNSPYIYLKDNMDLDDFVQNICNIHNISKISLQISDITSINSGLSYSHFKILDKLTKKINIKFVSSDLLSTRVMATRHRFEKEYYQILSKDTELILDEVFNNIYKYTNTNDIEYELVRLAKKKGYSLWFKPDVCIQRMGLKKSRNFNCDIKDGDLIHVDFGVSNILNTDVQRLYYLEGFKKMPKSFEQGFKEALKVQSLICELLNKRNCGNEVLKEVLNRTNKLDIKAQVYTHPLGFHGHGAGSAVGRYHSLGKSIKQGEYNIFYPSTYAIESNSSKEIPEWNNQLVYFFTEEDYWLDENSSCFLSDRAKSIKKLEYNKLK